MARKRMISPEIWESSSFSKLSDFAKLVFIGLFSNADDSGKGSADPGLLKSKLFPRDEKKRVTDVTNALSEIARHMSIIFYEVEGDSFYFLTAWNRWQKIDRPTPSKIPNPPETMGERGRTTQNSDFDEGSTNTRRILDEGSSPNGIERNGIEKNIPPNSACTREEESEFGKQFKSFCRDFEIADDNYYSSRLTELDFNKLRCAYLESQTLLMDKEKAPYAHTLSWVCKNYASIISGKFKDRVDNQSHKRERSRQTHDILEGLYNKYKEEEENSGTD